MAGGQDWHEWHAGYGDPTSYLSRRLGVVRGHITGWLDRRSDESLAVLSVCAGQGDDILGVLAARADAARVKTRLVEWDDRNVAIARHRAEAIGPTVTVVQADAGDLATYRDVAPADLLLIAGVFGNISGADIQYTILTLPQLCAAGATVIWTRHRRAPDLTPTIRSWFAGNDFAEFAFEAPSDALFSVGVHEFCGEPLPLRSTGRMFTFTR